MHIQSLFIYPVKSCRGLAVSQAIVEPRGFQHDRRWVIADGNQGHKFLTQRSHPVLAQITTAVNEAGHLILSHNGQGAMTIVPPVGGDDVMIPMWKETAPAYDAGDAAAAWLETVIADPACAPRLCYQADEHFRPVDPAYGQANDPLNFADGSPVLIVNQASLADLNSRLPQPASVDRFRANIVVDGREAFAEDRITHLQIGSVHFDLVNACDRCKIISLDQATGHQDISENNPLKALGDYRRGDRGKIYFGIDAIPRTTGLVKVGDTIMVEAVADIPHHQKDAA